MNEEKETLDFFINQIEEELMVGIKKTKALLSCVAGDVYSPDGNGGEGTEMKAGIINSASRSHELTKILNNKLDELTKYIFNEK